MTVCLSGTYSHNSTRNSSLASLKNHPQHTKHLLHSVPFANSTKCTDDAQSRDVSWKRSINVCINDCTYRHVLCKFDGFAKFNWQQCVLIQS